MAQTLQVQQIVVAIVSVDVVRISACARRSRAAPAASTDAALTHGVALEHNLPQLSPLGDVRRQSPSVHSCWLRRAVPPRWRRYAAPDRFPTRARPSAPAASRRRQSFPFGSGWKKPNGLRGRTGRTKSSRPPIPMRGTAAGPCRRNSLASAPPSGHVDGQQKAPKRGFRGVSRYGLESYSLHAPSYQNPLVFPTFGLFPARFRQGF